MNLEVRIQNGENPILHSKFLKGCAVFKRIEVGSMYLLSLLLW